MPNLWKKGVTTVVATNKFSEAANNSDRIERGPNPHKIRKHRIQPKTEPPDLSRLDGYPSQYVSTNQNYEQSSQSHNQPYNNPQSQYNDPQLHHNQVNNTQSYGNQYAHAQTNEPVTQTSFYHVAQPTYTNIVPSGYHHPMQGQPYPNQAFAFGTNPNQQLAATIGPSNQNTHNVSWDQGPQLESQARHQGYEYHSGRSNPPYEDYIIDHNSAQSSAVPRSMHGQSRSASMDTFIPPNPHNTFALNRSQTVPDPTAYDDIINSPAARRARQIRQERSGPPWDDRYTAPIYSEPRSSAS